MKKTVFFLFLFFSLASVSVFAQHNDDIVGVWLNSSKEGQLEIFKKGNVFYGKLVWVKEPKDKLGKLRTDVKNPDLNLRQQTILGLEILKNFEYTDEKWEKGTVYDPKSGKTYSGKLTLPNHNQLNMRGFIGVSLLGRTEVWKRIK